MESIRTFFKRIFSSQKSKEKVKVNFLKSFKYGLNAFILIALVLAIVVFANVIMVTFDYKIDLTPGRIFSISDVSKKIVASIPAGNKLEIYGMFDNVKQKKNPDYASWIELLNVYKNESKGKIDVIYKDIVTNPKLYKEIGFNEETNDPKNPPVLIFKFDKKSKVIRFNDLFVALQDENQKTVGRQINSEQVFSGAIKYVTSNLTPTIYFLEGHGENLPEGNFTELNLAFENNNFSKNKLNLLNISEIPKDCKTLFIFSPKKDISSDEKDIIVKYIKTGGSLFVSFSGAIDRKVTYENLQKVLDFYGLEVKNDVIAETYSDLIINDPKDSFLAGISSVEINKGFEGQPIQIINSRSIFVSNQKIEGVEKTDLISTSPYAESTNIVTGTKTKGIQNIVVGATRNFVQNNSKAIVAGSTELFSDMVSSNYQEINSAYFVNILNWLSNVDDDNIVASKQIDNYTFKLAEGPGVIILITTVIILPISILFVGLFVFLRRRHL